MKDLHLAISYSQDRIREVVRELETDGWLEITLDNTDGRSRRVMPTDRAIRMIETYRERLELGFGGKVSTQTASSADG